MPEYNVNEDLLQLIKDLQNRIEILEKVNPLNNGTVEEGNLAIKEGGSVWVYYPSPDQNKIASVLGDIYQESSGDYWGTGILVQNKNGLDTALIVGDVNNPSLSTFIFRDKNNRTLINDSPSGKGLDRPNIHYWMKRYDEGNFESTSTTYVTAFHCFANFWSPKVVCIFATGSVPGRARLKIDGVVAGSEVTWTQSQTITLNVTLPSSVNIGDTVYVELEMRSESGENAVVSFYMLRGGAA